VDGEINPQSAQVSPSKPDPEKPRLVHDAKAEHEEEVSVSGRLRNWKKALPEPLNRSLSAAICYLRACWEDIVAQVNLEAKCPWYTQKRFRVSVLASLAVSPAFAVLSYLGTTSLEAQLGDRLLWQIGTWAFGLVLGIPCASLCFGLLLGWILTIVWQETPALIDQDDIWKKQAKERRKRALAYSRRGVAIGVIAVPFGLVVLLLWGFVLLFGAAVGGVLFGLVWGVPVTVGASYLITLGLAARSDTNPGAASANSRRLLVVGVSTFLAVLIPFIIFAWLARGSGPATESDVRLPFPRTQSYRHVWADDLPFDGEGRSSNA